jgi:hypothetical protein
MLQASAKAPAHIWPTVVLNLIKLPAAQHLSADFVWWGLQRALRSAGTGAITPAEQVLAERDQSLVFEGLLKLRAAQMISCGRVCELLQHAEAQGNEGAVAVIRRSLPVQVALGAADNDAYVCDGVGSSSSSSGAGDVLGRLSYLSFGC